MIGKVKLIHQQYIDMVQYSLSYYNPCKYGDT